jgi:hypothetical protein
MIQNCFGQPYNKGAFFMTEQDIINTASPGDVDDLIFNPDSDWYYSDR